MRSERIDRRAWSARAGLVLVLGLVAMTGCVSRQAAESSAVDQFPGADQDIEFMESCERLSFSQLRALPALDFLETEDERPPTSHSCDPSAQHVLEQHAKARRRSRGVASTRGRKVDSHATARADAPCQSTLCGHTQGAS
jgi:hypothetical protein